MPVLLDAVDVADDPAVLSLVGVRTGLARHHQGSRSAGRTGCHAATRGLVVEVLQTSEAVAAAAERVAAEDQREDDDDDAKSAAAGRQTAPAAHAAASRATEILDLRGVELDVLVEFAHGRPSSASGLVRRKYR